jgi:heme A synthase
MPYFKPFSVADESDSKRFCVRVDPVVRRCTRTLMGMLIVQISLGISTLLLGVPVVLAAAHQAGALLLFTAALLTHHEVRHL